MNRRIFIILFALICTVLIIPAEAKTWYVDDSGGANFTDIQTAVNSASSGDNIYVYAGTYSGFNVNKPYITIIGEGADLVTITPNTAQIRIPEGGNDNATGTVLKGMKLSMLRLSTFGPASDCTVKNCILVNSISIEFGRYYSASNLTFEGNTVTGSGSINMYGQSSKSKILNNYFTGLSSSTSAIYFRQGANFCNFSNNVLENSTATNMLTVYNVPDCIISNNTFKNNTGIALRLYMNTVTDTTITHNIFSRNGGGIKFEDAGNNNKIYLNDFVENTAQLILQGTAPTTTIWFSPDQIFYTYNGTLFTGYMGNYWSDYTGTDANRDGIGDAPYVVPNSLGTDNYPLIQPLENYSVGSSVPVAAFNVTPLSGTAPLTVKFTDQSTGSPTFWLWDFGDGNNATGQNVSYTYNTAGNYTVNLTVSNTAGNDSEVKIDYIIVNESIPVSPVANFTADPISGTTPLTVQFTDTSTGNVTSWLWDFGDGTNNNSQNTSHTYNAAGLYNVSLNVTGSGGSNSTVKTNYINVTFLVTTNDLSITGIVNTVPPSAVFAREANTVTVTYIKNTGPALTNVSVAIYASDVSNGTVPVNTTTIASLGSGGTTTATIIDPTIRNLEGGSVTYTAVVDPDNLIAETDETNNNKSSAAKPVKYNGYKGKGIYWAGESNITTKHTYDLQGNLLYSTQPESAYKGISSWGSGRTETWSTSDLPIPAGSTIEKAYLYFAYNWDQTVGGYPWLNLSFNGNIIENGNLSTGNGNLYRDWSNFGAYADYEYGLCVYDVTDKFSSSGNSLVTVPYGSNNDLYGKEALYPSTLVVVYRNSNETRKQIFINEECDELGLSQSSYATTLEEATAYVPFTNMTIDVSKVENATLYSFAGSAGPDEGNLLFNGNLVSANAWQGSSSTSSPLVFGVKNYLTSTGNEAGVQGTASGGMDALQQILVVEYPKEIPDTTNPVIDSVVLFPANTTAGSKISISVNTTDNVEVTGVTAGDVPLAKTDDVWQGSITAPSTVGIYSLSINASDAAGNVEGTSVPYNVVQLSGSSSIAVSPKISNVAAGSSVSPAVVVKNSQSTDDTFKVWISVSELPASSQANLSWFGWTEQSVKISAGEEVSIPVKVDVPAGTAVGRKLFRANVKSETNGISGFNTGYLTIA